MFNNNMEETEKRSTGKVKKTVIRLGSGTSGVPHFTIRPITEEPQGPFRDGRRFLLLYGGRSVRLNHVVRRLYGNDSPHVEGVLSLDAADSGPSLEALFSEFAPDVLWGTPSFCERVTELVQDAKALHHVTLCIIGGEMVSRTKISALARKLPNAFISVSYSTAEVGIIGRACQSAPLGSYHPVPSVEIRLVAGADGIGEIVVCKEGKEYRTGDSGRSLGECPCGEKITFELLGRTNFDFIRLSGATLFQEEFDRVSKELGMYIEDYRIEAWEEHIGERVCGKIELSILPHPALLERSNPEKFIAIEYARRLFLTPLKTLEALIAQGDFLPLSVVHVERFPSQEKNVRMRLRKQ